MSKKMKNPDDRIKAYNKFLEDRGMYTPKHKYKHTLDYEGMSVAEALWLGLLMLLIVILSF